MNRMLFFGATGLGVLLVVLLVGVGSFSLSGSCSEEERQVYEEFPQFGNTKIEPEPFSETGGCAAFYDTPASQERGAEYYMEQLKAHGWQVEKMVSEATLMESGRTAPSIWITASRNDFFYEVGFESLELYDPPRPGVHVAVHVFDG